MKSQSLCLFAAVLFLLIAPSSILQGQEGKISKYSISLYGGSFEPSKLNFRNGTYLKDNKTFLIGAAIYNHLPSRTDIFIRSEILYHSAEIVSPLCNCSERFLLNSNSTLEAGILYYVIKKQKSQLAIGLSLGFFYDILNNNTIEFAEADINDLEKLSFFIRKSPTLGYLLSPGIQYNLQIRKSIHLFASIGISGGENTFPTSVIIEKYDRASYKSEVADQGTYSNNYILVKAGILYDFSIMWLKN